MSAALEDGKESWRDYKKQIVGSIVGLIIILGFISYNIIKNHDERVVNECLSGVSAPVLVASYNFDEEGRTDWQLRLLGNDTSLTVVDCDTGGGIDWCNKNNVERKKLPGWYFQEYGVLRYGVFSKDKLSKMAGCKGQWL